MELGPPKVGGSVCSCVPGHPARSMSLSMAASAVCVIRGFMSYVRVREWGS